MSSENKDISGKTGDSEPKSLFDKVLAFLTAMSSTIIVAIIGIISSYTIQKSQDSSERVQLYTQLMSQRENAESGIRKDMFEKVLSSFLENGKGAGSNDAVCILKSIDDDLLRLELLSRNFHEMLDMEPLFTHVLLKTVRNVPELLNIEKSSNDNRNPAVCADELNRLYLAYSKKICKNTDEYDSQYKEEHGKDQKNDFKLLCKNISDDTENNNSNRNKFLDKINWLVTSKYIDKIVKIANRITRKQIDSLNSVLVRYTFSINIKETCSDNPPNSHDINCKNQWQERKVALKLSDGEKRNFHIKVNQSYPKWNTVKVNIAVQKTQEELAFNKASIKEISSNGSNDRTQEAKDWNESEFWLSYYDFPLSENTFISDREMYAVVLDSFDTTKQEAQISLLYFPAAAAGLKEKTFYQQKLLNTLIKKDGL